jgi:hypothetical protein
MWGWEMPHIRASPLSGVDACAGDIDQPIL